MSGELFVLCLAGILYLFAWLPSSLAKAKSFGPKWLASNREASGAELVAWGGRCERAYQNLKDNFPGFIIAVLAIELTSTHGTLSLVLCWVYLVCRIGHFMSYGIGLVYPRAILWIGGLAANLCLFAIALLGF